VTDEFKINVSVMQKSLEATPLHSQFVAIKSVNEDRQIVFGVVYSPNVIDTWGEMMLPSDVELMAYRFMETVKLSKSIDHQHDEKPTTSFPVESFIARKGDPDYPEGAWVLGVKIVDAELWRDVKSGKINGFSYQCMVRKMPAIVEVETYAQLLGETEKTEDHTHLFYAEVDDAGLVVSGKTSPAADGHTHIICGGTATEDADGHSHRFFV
jgi:hypothetical protein